MKMSNKLDFFDIKNIDNVISNIHSSIREIEVMVYNDLQKFPGIDYVRKDKYLNKLRLVNNEITILYDTIKEI